MSIAITVKQKIFGRKPMPLEVILGKKLQYGDFRQDHLYAGELGETEFVAYHPKHIGRGFSVVWNPREKKEISFHLPQPSTARELRDFYDAVQRVTEYWGGSLYIEGKRSSLKAFLAGYEDMLIFNTEAILRISREFMQGDGDFLSLYSAKWPMEMGRQEAGMFLDDPESFATWLHERQSLDVCYSCPHLYDTAHGLVGRYVLCEDIAFLFPYKPRLPFGMADPETGKELICSDWRVAVGLLDGDQPLGELSYEQFMNRLPADKMLPFDAGKLQVLPMTEAELRQLLDAGS